MTHSKERLQHQHVFTKFTKLQETLEITTLKRRKKQKTQCMTSFVIFGRWYKN